MKTYNAIATMLQTIRAKHFETNGKIKSPGQERKAIKNQMEILELKNTISEIKYSLDGLKNRNEV